MSTTTAQPFTFVNRGRTAPAVHIVAIQNNALNLPIYTVTPMGGGMEQTDYIGTPETVPAEAWAMVEQARSMAQATGARSATYTKGGVSATYHATRWSAFGMVTGLHRAKGSSSAEQAALKAEHAQNPTNPAKGDRFIVATLSGYRLIQNRPLDHRSCSCHTGDTTYAAGTVERVTAWADNSVDVLVRLEDGFPASVQIVAPHGDACF